MSPVTRETPSLCLHGNNQTMSYIEPTLQRGYQRQRAQDNAAINTFDSYDAIALAKLVASGEVSSHEPLETSLSLAELRNPTLNALVRVNGELAHQRIPQGYRAGRYRVSRSY